MVLKLSKNVSFLQFFADIKKEPNAVIAVHVYASETFGFAFLENSFAYYALIQKLEQISA